MDIFRLMLLAAEEEEDNAFDGLFSGAAGAVGIVLMVTGLLLIYFGIKVIKGYRFLPTGDGAVIQEDNYIEAEAKLTEQKKIVMPDFGGGSDREFIEWEMVYTVDGREYTQTIPDDGYEKDGVLKIKYDPADPSAFYLADEGQDASDEDGDDTDLRKETVSMAGIVIIVLGVLVIIGGAALSFM